MHKQILKNSYSIPHASNLFAGNRGVIRNLVIGVKKQDDMGSRSEGMLNSRFPVVKEADVTSLTECASLMGPDERRLFEKAYGNILRLLQLDRSDTHIPGPNNPVT